MKGLLKRVFSSMLLLVLLVTGMDLSFISFASAEETAGSMTVSETPDELLSMGEWLYWVEDGRAIVAGYTNLSEANLTVPFNLGGYPVTGIGHKAFSENLSLKSIHIHTNVTSIAQDAFEGMRSVIISAYNGAYALVYASNTGMHAYSASRAAGFVEGVIDLTGVNAKAYSSLTDTSVVFNKNDATFLKVGQIVYFPASSQYPTGQAREISKISVSGEKLNVSLGNVDLANVFTEFSGEAELYPDWDNAIYSDGVENVSDENDVSAEKIYDKAINPKKWSKKILDAKKSYGDITINGKVTVGIDPYAKIKIEKDKTKFYLKEAEIKATITTDSSFKVTYEAKKNEKAYISKVSNSKKKYSLGKTEVPLISGYGFTGYAVIEIICELNGELELKFSTSTTYKYTYKNGDWYNSSPGKTTGTPFAALNGSLKAGPQFSLWITFGIANVAEIRIFDFSVSLYTEVEGSVKVHKVEGNASAFTCVDIEGGIYLNVKVKVGIINIKAFAGILSYDTKKASKTFNKKFDIYTFADIHIDGEIKSSLTNLKVAKKCRLTNREVVYWLNNGKGEIKKKYKVNDKVTLIDAPTRSGYRFAGWYVDADKSNLSGKDYKITSSSVKMPYLNNDRSFHIYAKWDEIKVVKSIKLNKTSITGLSNVGATEKLSVSSLSPSDAENKNVKWSSSNTNVATVDSNGNVKLLNAGTATITCTSVGNSSVKATCTVTVKQSVTGIRLDKDNIFRYSDDLSPVQLNVIVDPNSAADKAVKWTSSNPQVAEVSSGGNITLKGVGTATITCESVSNPNVKATCAVTVRQAVTGIALDKENYQCTSSDMSALQLNAMVYPETAWDKSLKWETSNASVATVSDTGLVTMKGVGEATITCRSVSNPAHTASFKLKITQAVTEIVLSETAITRYSDSKEVVQPKADVRPGNAENKNVTWTSSAPSVVKVSDNGAVTIVGVGSAVITCRSVSNPNVCAECKFTVLQAVTGITLNKTSINTTSDDLNAHELTASVAPANAANKAVVWESSNPAVAAVTVDGVVTIKGVGSAVITCRSVSTPEITATCTIKVVQAVTDMKLNETNIVRYSREKDDIQLIATLTADEQANVKVTWKSSNINVASVSDSGVVSIKGVGEAVITCVSVSNPDVKAECKITVKQSVEKIELNKNELVCYSDNTTAMQLNASVSPSDAANKNVRWVSSNTSVAAVSDTGVVTIAGPGSAVITCASVSDPSVSASCNVTVRQQVSSVQLNQQEIIRNSNETSAIELTANVQPANAYEKGVKWESSNVAVATVNAQGVVQIVSAGEAVITCQSISNPNAQAKCRIVVKQAVGSVSLDKTSLTLNVGDTAVQLTAEVLPNNAENKAVVWTSSNPSVAAVSDKGLVSIVGRGEAVITCASKSNPTVIAECRVTVKQQVSSISLNESEIVRYSDEKEQVQLVANVQPANADDKTLEWTSSNENVVTVSADGALTIVGVGEAKITVRNVANPEVSAQCVVVVKQPMTAITIDRSEVTLYNHDEAGVQLISTVAPSNTADTDVIWESSNMDVAIVSDNGVVKAIADGTAVITCRSMRNPETVFASCNVTVLQAVEEIEIGGLTDSLLLGETVQLTAFCAPENAENKNVTWTSSNVSVAVVDEKGLVTAKDYGTAVITATAKDGQGASASYTVTVDLGITLKTEEGIDTVYVQGTSPVELGRVSLTGASVRRMKEQGIEPVWTLVKPDGNDNVKLRTDTVTVTDNGQDYETTCAVLEGSSFSAAGIRTYIVKCEAASYSETAEITISVDGNAYAQKGAITPSTITMKVGETYQLPSAPISADGKAIPAGTMLYGFEGDEYFKEHAVISENETGSAIGFDLPGSYTAVVEYASSNIVYEINLSFFIQNENGVFHIRVEDIALEESIIDLVEGDSYTLKAAVTPADATDTTVTWSSSDENIVTVDQNGCVKAVASGWAAIFCTANDGSGASAMCFVSVESFLQLDDEALEYTIYNNGDQYADLGIVNVTIDSERRLHEAGLNVTWKLEKISGTATSVGVEEFQAELEESITISGNQIKLLRMNGIGTDVYRLLCKAGEHTAECRIVIHVENAEIPKKIQLAKSTYNGKINEVIAVDTSYTGGTLPAGTVMSIRGGNAFENALAAEYDFTEPEKLIFQTAGTYSAEIVFEGSNYNYVCPITVVVTDRDGKLPVNITGITVVPEYLYMQVGDQANLAAAVEPQDANYSLMTWSSADTAIATVSSNGRVTALGAGDTYITVSVPESDFVGGCYVVVEDGLTLQKESVERTIFVDGTTRTQLDTVLLTTASSSMLNKAPEWSLVRVSGNNLTLKVEDYYTTDEDGQMVYGCNIILYSVSREGTAKYDLICKANGEEVTIPVMVHAVARDRNLPSGLNLKQTVFSAGVNELLAIEPEIVCLPAGTELPDGMRVELTGDKLFVSARNVNDFYVSQNRTTLSFNRAGQFEANFIFSYSNMRYVVPVTFRIADDNGYVPILSATMTLSSRSLWLVDGETAKLNAVFTPANADNRQVTWKSSNESVVTVDADGNVTAVGKGTANISCTPEDSLMTVQICSVWVEDYLMLDTAEDYVSLYRQGAQKNEVFSALLSEGTISRLKKDGLKPQWEITKVSGEHSDVSVSLSEQGDKLIALSTKLKSGGKDVYRVTCKAGEHVKMYDFTLEVLDLGNVPEEIMLASKQVKADVGQTLTIDFTPVCKPDGSVIPNNDDMWDMYSGIGQDYYDAMDYDAYNEDGDFVTVRFTKPGRYLLSRQFFLNNLHYEQVCEIIVGQAETPFNLLKAGAKEAVVYMGGKAGVVTEITLNDSILHDLYGDELSWSLERVSGNSLTATLKEIKNGVSLYAVSADAEGEDLWRITCTFGDFSESVEIRIDVQNPRSQVPESLALAVDSLSGVMGEWLNLPLAVDCKPEGSALPETGDDFWTFELSGMDTDVCEWSIKDGILRVRFLQSGYYTGILRYEAGNFRYSMPVHMSITDEEGILNAPSMQMYLINTINKVYQNGNTDVAIGMAQISRGNSAYYQGEAEAYMKTYKGEWSVRIVDGAAATFEIRENGSNTASIMLASVEQAGDVTYEVSCLVNGMAFTAQGTLEVLNASEKAPVPVLENTVFHAKPGEVLIIPTTLYDRENASILQSVTEWDPDAFLPAIGYEFTQTDDSLQVAFYKEGTYSTKITAKIGNMVYDVPFTIVIGDDPQPEYFVMKLPASLNAIRRYAFRGSMAQVVDLRGTKVTRIEEGAFSNCTSLVFIYIPETVTSIAEDAFSGSANVTIVCKSGSKADTFATEHGIAVRYE